MFCRLGPLALLGALAAPSMAQWPSDPYAKPTWKDRAGLSVDAIISMGEMKFWDYTLSSGIEWKMWPRITYGNCLAIRNDRIIRRLPARDRVAYRRLRTQLYRFGFATITFEFCWQMGTTPFHAARTLFIERENLLYALLKNEPYRSRRDYAPAIIQRLKRNLGWKQAMYSQETGRLIDASVRRRFARRQSASFHAALAEVRKIDNSKRGRVLTFLNRWAFWKG